MRKIFLSILVLASVMLSACAKATPTLEPIASLVQPSTQPEVPSSPGLNEPPASCTVVTKRPTQSPTEESLFPPVSEDDHVRGPETAKLTLIEYSDFQ